MEPLPAPSPSPSPPPLSALPHRQGVPAMDFRPQLTEDSSSIWDLSYLLDFNLEDQMAVSFDNDQNSQIPQQVELPLPPPSSPATDKVRKRDPRLTCSNFLAGQVPCACPELDAKLGEEGLPGKKRARTVRASAGIARCQVPGCEVDISELKGYHRRHRVCLWCANASTVMLDGEAKRYCQQCGKFHILSDFDEGKRSCRRKLERHNIRRRRKPADSGAATEPQPLSQIEDSIDEGEPGKDCSNLSSEINEKGAALDPEDEPLILPCSAPDTQNVNSDSVVSFVASGDTQMNNGKDVSNFSNSPSYCEKSAYSSLCQTGRISFKLYDWNPAEFPRRLRHQIFQWLASMPLELEGYIRPGCTILTSFIAMPKAMWVNLNGNPMHYVCDLVAPGKILSGRGTALVHLNDMIFCVVKGGTSVTNVEVNMQAPRLHYVHPTCFEAGKPMEFVACGSNLMQAKFRLLLSFSGKYLKYEYLVASPHYWAGDNISCAFDNQLYKIYVPLTEENLFGPAFIEVENESGLSNFIPVLIGDKDICSEMKMLQQKLDVFLLSKQSDSASGSSICSSCEAFALRHASSSDLLLDIAWLLKDPTSEKFDRVMMASQIQRYCYLLDFLIYNESTIILGKILPNLVILTENMKSNNLVDRMSDVDVLQLLKIMNNARDVICQKHSGSIALHSDMGNYKFDHSSSQDYVPPLVVINSKGIMSRADAELEVERSPTFNDKNETVPLLKREIIVNMGESPMTFGRSRSIARGFLSSRPAILVIASVALCLGVCVAFLHHGRVSEFAVSIRRCLFNNS